MVVFEIGSIGLFFERRERMVYYRKYRPQNISDLDSQGVREKLYSVLSGNVPHAFLFTGPKGLGKTSTARIVAKAINCERLVDQRLASSSKDKKLNAERHTLNANVEPCNECSQCISITNGTNLDILEIDGASNRGIDEIRDLREKIGFAPLSARKKVYIIDEVHMLTTEAFNALLKTLEEPPSHALFILCTTEPHKVPETILSRCFHIAFTKATPQELVRSFERILTSEKITYNKDALLQIASLSDGSFRDGAKILEEVVSLADGKGITKELIEKKFQISNIQFQISNMLLHLREKDAKASLLLIAKLVDQGVDMKFFIEQCIDALHILLLHKIGIETEDKFSIFNFQFSIPEIKTLVELLTKAHQELKYAVLPQLPLELAIIEYSSSGAQAESRSPLSSRVQTISSVRGDLPEKKIAASLTAPRNDSVNSEFSDVWKKLIDAVKTQNQSVAGVLRGCTISRYDTKELLIETKYTFHKERLEEKKAMTILEIAAQEIAGKKIKVSVILKETK